MAAEAETEQELVNRVQQAVWAFNEAYWDAIRAKLEVEIQASAGAGLDATVRRRLHHTAIPK